MPILLELSFPLITLSNSVIMLLDILFPTFIGKLFSMEQGAPGGSDLPIP